MGTANNAEGFKRCLGFIPEISGNLGFVGGLVAKNYSDGMFLTEYWPTEFVDIVHEDFKTEDGFRRASKRFFWEFPYDVITDPFQDGEYFSIGYLIQNKPRAYRNYCSPLERQWNDDTIKEYSARNPYIIFSDSAGFANAIYFRDANVLFFRYCETQEPEMIEELKKRIKRLTVLVRPAEAKLSKKVNGLMGADIEFTVYDSDQKFHSATEFVGDTQEGQIGTDGNVDTLEIRPDVAKNPLDLVANIEELLGNLNDSLPPGHDLLGGGGGKLKRATGTHIHFSGISTDIDKRPQSDPIELVRWLDTLILDPVYGYMKGTNRNDPHYGQAGDYRNQRNHNGFPHKGFEWRPLPTMTIDREFTKGLFCLAWCIMLAYEMGKTIKFDQEKFGIEWYEGLPEFDKYSEYIKVFVEKIKDKVNLEIPILSQWFGKEFKKDRECDVEVVFCNDEDGHLGIHPFVMYNPQKMFDRIVIWSRATSQSVALSAKATNLQRYLLAAIGTTCNVQLPSEALVAKYLKGRTLFIGIPSVKINALAQKNAGSRNRVKMFVQDLIKNI